jgi:8-oxo-dGTP diphosphatase
MGEDPLDAVLRELLEETGLAGEVTGILTVRGDPARDPRKHVVSIIYTVEAEGNPVGGDDAADARFWAISDILAGRLEIAADHNIVLRDWLAP